MRVWDAWRKRAESLLLRSRAEQDLAEELRSHFDRLVEHKIAGGMTAQDAKREAAREFGNLEQTKEECREAWGLRLIDELRQDLRYSLRTLRRTPGFAVAVIAILGLGIGANTAIFSAVYGVLLKPLPYRDADRLVQIWQVAPPGAGTDTGSQPPSSGRRRVGWKGRLDGVSASAELAPADFADLRSRARLFSQMVAADPYSFSTADTGDPVQLRGYRVSRGFFEIAGVGPALGRTFADDEFTPGKERVAMLSYAAWQSRFGGDPAVAGREVTFDGQRFTIVGVMPPEFKLPVGGYYSEIDLWTPQPEPGEFWGVRASSFWPAMARLAPGVTLEQARQELNGIGERLAEEYPRTNRARRFEPVPLREHLTAGIRPPLVLLLGASGVLLVLACVNVAGLILVRGSRLRRELAVRVALGASTARVARQLIAESALLAAGGCVAGVTLAYAMVPVLLRLNPATSPLFDGVAIESAVLFFSVALCCAALLAFGAGPAVRLAAMRSWHGLGLGSPTIGEGLRTQRLRGFLVAGQIALCVTLLAGAGLLTRTLVNLMQVDPGFRREGVLTAQVSYFRRVRTDEQSAAFLQETIARLKALPGATAAAAVSNLPFHDTPVDYRAPVSIQGRPQAADAVTRQVLHTIVTAGYFGAMGIPVREGRGFSDADRLGGPLVAVINRAMQRQYWRGEPALGARVRLGYPVNNVVEIVGVVEDVKHQRLDVPAEPEIYVAHAQAPVRLMTFAVRTASEPEALAPAVKSILAEALPGIPLGEIATLKHFHAESVRSERFSAFLLGSLASAALLLAAVGLYGVMSYWVAARQGEIGIRMALGAQPRGILRGVLARGLALAAIGIACGMTAALALTRLLRGMLFGIEANDPATFAAIAGLTVAISALACAAPAWRASRVDPVRTLRA